MLGKTLSRCKILEEIGRGGMGVVYRARDVKLNRDVALEVLRPELVAGRFFFTLTEHENDIWVMSCSHKIKRKR